MTSRCIATALGTSLALTAFVGCEAASRQMAGAPGMVTAVGSVGATAWPSVALSLETLQRRAREARAAHRPLSEELLELAGVNHIRGFLVEPDWGLILLGDRTADPAIHFDDLVVAVRNAYLSQEPPGCSIDPWEGAEDPWAIQRVRVFGMPPTAPMAVRQVDLDFELKWAVCGIRALDGVESVFAIWRSDLMDCGRSERGSNRADEAERFWFTALYPDRPRYLGAEGIVLILRPVEVQLLAEREFMNRTGERAGSAQASPAAREFAARVSRRLRDEGDPHYAALRNDFRIIELGRLLLHRDVVPARLRYLLEEHVLSGTRATASVAGLWRLEEGAFVCSADLHEAELPNGIAIQGRNAIHSYRLKVRGGVEAAIHLSDGDFSEPAGGLGDLRRIVRASRPSVDSLAWPIEGSREAAP